MAKQSSLTKSIEIVDEGEGFVSVRFVGFPSYFVNAIRRRIINSVEVAAIDEIEIIKNTSGLYDEMLAHRLGMIPFKFNKKVLLNKESKECKDNLDSPRCKIKFVLKAKGPAKVYAKDIKAVHEDFKPLYDDILIVRLLEGQEIDIEGSIVLGTGKDHAKFIPALVSMKEVKEDEEYVLTIESISALHPKDILKEALSKLNTELKMISKLF